MSKKAFFIILVLSVVVWYISRYIVALYEVLILKRFQINLFGDSCLPTGYPLFNCAGNNFSLVFLGAANIIIWFIIIWVSWKVLQKVMDKK